MFFSNVKYFFFFYCTLIDWIAICNSNRVGFQSRCWSVTVCVFIFISWIIRCCHGLCLHCKSPFLDCPFLVKSLHYVIVIQFLSLVVNIFIIPSNLCLFYLVCYYHHCIITHQFILLYLILQIPNSLIIILIESGSCFFLWFFFFFISITSLLHHFFLSCLISPFNFNH